MGVSVEAGARQREGATRRPVAKSPDGGRVKRGKPFKVTLHLDAETAERLGVHATLCHRDRSRVANEILYSYLVRYGRGALAFGSSLRDDPDAQEASAEASSAPV